MTFPSRTLGILSFSGYSILIVLATLTTTVSGTNRAIFFLYSAFIFWIFHSARTAEPGSIESSTQRTNQKRFWRIFLLFAVILLILSRIIIFVRFGEAPLGYDTGFYLKYFDDVPPWYTVGIHDIQKVPLYLFWIPFSFLGLSTVAIFHLSQVLAQLLIAGALYVLIRSIYHKNSLTIPAIAVFLFATSLTQYFGFWWAFSKQTFALTFLLITLALYLRRSPLAIFTAGFGAAMHLPTFVPFGIAFGLFTMIQVFVALYKKKPIPKDVAISLIMGTLMLAIIFLWQKNDIVLYAKKFIPSRFLTTNLPDWEVAQAEGLFINFKTFRMTSLLFLPFALLGLFSKPHLTHERANPTHRLLLRLLFLVWFIFVTFPLIYQHRFLIHFDILLLVFSAYPLVTLFHYFFPDQRGRIALAILTLGFIVNISYVSWAQEPQLFPRELKEIKHIARIAEPDSYAMATDALYTPWVWGFSGRPTIAPGYLAWDRWGYPAWVEFWNTGSNERRHDLLGIYNAPIYLFVGERQSHTMAFMKFIKTDPAFINISPHVWKYQVKKK